MELSLSLEYLPNKPKSSTNCLLQSAFSFSASLTITPRNARLLFIVVKSFSAARFRSGSRLRRPFFTNTNKPASHRHRDSSHQVQPFSANSSRRRVGRDRGQLPQLDLPPVANRQRRGLLKRPVMVPARLLLDGRGGVEGELGEGRRERGRAASDSRRRRRRRRRRPVASYAQSGSSWADLGRRQTAWRCPAHLRQPGQRPARLGAAEWGAAGAGAEPLLTGSGESRR